MKRNYWAINKGIKVKDIEKAQERLTTFGLFGQKQDVVFDDPNYKGSSSDEEPDTPKQEVIVIPADID